MNIPFVDLKVQYQSIKSEIDLTVQNVINDVAFIGGEYVEKFELSILIQSYYQKRAIG